MSLTKAQKEVLDKYNVPLDIQTSLGQALDENGNPKPNMASSSSMGTSSSKDNSPYEHDFLLLVSDKLHETEDLLYNKRQELAFELKKIKSYNLDERPRQIIALEDIIKDLWTTATALWRVADQIVNQPEEGFKVVISAKQVEYVLKTKNLPVLELIRWAKPEIFYFHPPFTALRWATWVLGGLGGAVLGLFGGFFGGIKYGLERFRGIGKLSAAGYCIAGLIFGWAVGGVMGARMGFDSGNPLLACIFGMKAAFLNPLNQPKGTLNRHAVELMKEEILFSLAKK